MKKFLTLLLIIGSVALIGFSAWQIITVLQERYICRTEYEQARESYVSAIQPKQNADVADVEADPFPKIDIDVEGLLEKNEDYVAWLYYEDAKISYPIVQESGDEVNKYIHTTFDGTENPAGCIFMPFDSDPMFRYMNTFLYGHNMKDGSMFGRLKNIYRDPKEAKNPYFYIWDLDENVTRYRVFAMYVVDKSDPMYSIPLKIEAYRDYVDKALKLGSMDGYIPFTEAENQAMEEGAPVVTLSTCYGSAGTSRRLLVQGVAVETRTE